MLSCRYHKLSTSSWREGNHCTCENWSASQKDISSDASGYTNSQQRPNRLHAQHTLFLSGWNSINSVSRTTLSVSTSSPSLVRAAMSPRRAPDATEAGYSLAKLRRPSMAARRSSRRVALASRLLRVLIVSVAVCLGGAWASSTRIILGGWMCNGDHDSMVELCKQIRSRRDIKDKMRRRMRKGRSKGKKKNWFNTQFQALP
jgi:hypothetical protein